jgi:hypothetical protein
MNLDRIYKLWWQFVDSRGVELTEWQTDVAISYLSKRPMQVEILRGRGQSFVHGLLRDFVTSSCGDYTCRYFGESHLHDEHK